jgi:cytoskeletal protein CcmA (bactofilin family)
MFVFKTQDKMGKLNETENTAINLISSGTEIIGDVKSTGDIRIDGTLTGNLNTKGKVVIGPTGKVKGEVFCKNSEVSGMVDGKICVGQLLSLKISSKIIGEIVTFKLSIEPGASFTGNCRMSESENYEGPPAAKGKEPEKVPERSGK